MLERIENNKWKRRAVKKRYEELSVGEGKHWTYYDRCKRIADEMFIHENAINRMIRIEYAEEE